MASDGCLPPLSSGGCEFRVLALHLDGWSFSSVASAVAATPALAPMPSGGVRLELRLLPSALSLSGGEAMVGGLLLRDLASTLHELPERFHLVELRLHGRFAIFDVRPLGGDVGDLGASCVRVRELVLALVADPHSSLYSAEVGRAVDRLGGVWAHDANGVVHPLPMPSREWARLTLLAEGVRQASTHEVGMGALLALSFALALVARLRSRSPPGQPEGQPGQRSGGGGGKGSTARYTKGLPSDDDDNDAQMTP